MGGSVINDEEHVSRIKELYKMMKGTRGIVTTDEITNQSPVPATVNGTSSTIAHVTLIGNVKYSTSDLSIQVENNYINANDIRGTNY
jgi:outer membrane protein assembly factor BamA